MKKLTLKEQFQAFYVDHISSKETNVRVICTDPDNLQFAVIPNVIEPKFPFYITIHQVDARELDKQVGNIYEILELVSDETYRYDSKEQIMDIAHCMPELEDAIEEEESILTIAMLVSETEHENEYPHILPNGLNDVVLSFREVLLASEVNLEEGEPISLSQHPELVDKALTNNYTVEDILDALNELVSDETGSCVEGIALGSNQVA